MKFSLDIQIEEVEQELRMRRDVYPRLARNGKQRESIGEMKIARMEAALATLKWVRENREAIKAAVVGEP